jgi:uncharacterized surface protein with fasciclin (FAS1) repeats
MYRTTILAPRCAPLLVAALLLSAPVAQGQHSSRIGATIPQVAKTAGTFTTLLAAVDAAGLTETLLGRGPFTVFAPTDDAFKRLPNGTVEELLKPQNREKLRTILTYHVVAGRVTAAQARDVRSAQTVAGQSVRISQDGDQLRINDATVRIADIPASNGIIHVIDRVLIPSDKSANANGGSAADLIDLAIDRGAPLYNDGQPAATVAIYEVAASALLAGGAVTDDAQRTLRTALRDATRNGSAREKALALRAALDEARRNLTGRMEVSRR